MVGAKRRKAILDWLQQEPIVMVRDFAETFNVTETTIRRDLEVLEEQGSIERAYGCAILKKSRGIESPLRERRILNQAGKQAVGLAASKLVNEGDTIFIDGGTTTEFILPHLIHFQKLTIVTSGFNIAMYLAEHPHITTIVLGGLLDPPSMTLIPVHSENLSPLKELRVDRAFISASSVSAQFGVMNKVLKFIPTKKIAIEISVELIFVVDGSKIGEVALGKIAPLSAANYLVTDATAPREEIEKIEALGVNVIVAQIEAIPRQSS